jgi:hypothetical protein
MIARGLTLVLAALAGSGCVMHERYRYVQEQAPCFAPGSDPVPGAPGERRPFPSVDCRSALFKAAFVEFDEAGGLIDPAQADKAMALVLHEKARAANGKVITFVYVHGWKNNGNQAAPGAKPKDVEKFFMALSELGYRAWQANPAGPVPVVGIYIGWRGKSLMGPGAINWLSYWGRRNTANRIGGDALTALLNRAIETSVPNRDDRSRVVLVGHSFGARVLERAVENGVMLYDPEALRSQAEPVKPRVDLVFYVNAANDSRLGLARVQALRQQPITVRHPDYDPVKCTSGNAAGDPICRDYPLLVAITSRGDAATRRVQPFANAINFDGDNPPFPPLPPDEFLDDPPTRGQLRGTAPANLPFLQSHVLEETVCPVPPEPVACTAGNPSCAFAFQGRGECTACFTARKRQPLEAVRPFNETAYWIMDVDARIIRDHGDIWNQSKLSMLGAMLAPRGFFESGTGRMQVRPQ